MKKVELSKVGANIVTDFRENQDYILNEIGDAVGVIVCQCIIDEGAITEMFPILKCLNDYRETVLSLAKLED